MLTTWFSSVYGSFPCWPKTVVLAATWKKQTNELQSWEKVLGHLFICGNYLKSPTPNPFPTQQTMLNVYMSIQIFSRVSTLYRVRREEKRELQDIFKKVSLFYDGTQNYRKLRILHHFPQDFCWGLYFTAILRESCWIYLFCGKYDIQRPSHKNHFFSIFTFRIASKYSIRSMR